MIHGLDNRIRNRFNRPGRCFHRADPPHLLLTLFRNIFGSVGHKEGEKPAPKPVRAPAPAAPAKPAPVILSDDEGEVAAAITAALAVILAEEGAGKTYAVRSIKRVRTGRSAWGTAGLTENVRPF